jgi:hypothetical protein
VPVVTRDLNVQEGLTAVFLRPSLTLAAGRTASWSLAGTDAARFSIDAATGALVFRQAPDTASPGDADGHNDYELSLQVSDGVRSAQAPVTVRVLPWNQGGAAVLPLPPAPREVARPAGSTRVRNTFYINLAANWYPQWNDPTRFDAVWQDAMAQGSEIGNHTTHHCRAAELTDNNASTCPSGLAGAGAEFDDTTNYIRTKIGQAAVWTAAYPFGDTGYGAAAASRFFIARGVSPGMVAREPAATRSTCR